MEGNLGLARNVSLMLAVSLIAPSAALAAKNVTADIDQIAGVLRDAGYQAEIHEAGGERAIRSSAGGYRFVVLVFGCDDNQQNCKSTQFYAGFTPDKAPTLQAMNDYAATHRFGRIYIDDDGDPVIEMDVDLEAGGMSEALFKDNIAYWSSVMGGFAQWVNEQDEK